MRNIEELIEAWQAFADRADECWSLFARIETGESYLFDYAEERKKDRTRALSRVLDAGTKIGLTTFRQCMDAIVGEQTLLKALALKEQLDGSREVEGR